EGPDLGRNVAQRDEHVVRVWVMGLRPIGRRRVGLRDGVAVIDREELLTFRVHVAERAQLLAWVDRVPRDRRWMGIRTPDDARRAPALSGDEPAGLLRCLGAGVGDDRVAQRRGERQPVGQPPAIAGMTMTSPPSGTAVPRPPEVRASVSPTYTFT